MPRANREIEMPSANAPQPPGSAASYLLFLGAESDFAFARQPSGCAIGRPSRASGTRVCRLALERGTARAFAREAKERGARALVVGVANVAASFATPGLRNCSAPWRPVSTSQRMHGKLEDFRC